MQKSEIASVLKKIMSEMPKLEIAPVLDKNMQKFEIASALDTAMQKLKIASGLDTTMAKFDIASVLYEIMSEMPTKGIDCSMVTGECGSGKSFLFLCELMLKNIELYTKKGYVSDKILFVCPNNMVRSAQQQSLWTLLKIMKNKSSEWYRKLGLSNFPNLINAINALKSAEDFVKNLSYKIVNPEKMCHFIGKIYKEKKQYKVEKIIIDEYHCENNFYQAFLSLLPRLHTICEGWNVKVVLVSGTPTMTLSKQVHLESSLKRDIREYTMEISRKLIPKREKLKREYSYKISANLNLKSKLEEIKKNNEKVLIVGNSKNNRGPVEKVYKDCMDCMKLKKEDVIYINSDSRLNIDELNKIKRTQLLIASPGSVSQGPTIEGLRLIINFNCYPNLPVLLPMSEEGKTGVKWYKNSKETNDQIKGRLGRVENKDSTYYMINVENELPVKEEYLDILTAMLVLGRYFNISISEFTSKHLNSENLSSIFSGDCSWADKSRKLIMEVLELHRGKFFEGKTSVDGKSHDMFEYLHHSAKSTEHEISVRLIQAYLKYNSIENTILFESISEAFKCVYTGDVTYKNYYNKILEMTSLDDESKEVLWRACKNHISSYSKKDSNADEDDEDEEDDDEEEDGYY